MAADLRRAQMFKEALQVYQDLVKDEPSDAESYLRMSNIYTQLRDFAKAREAEDKARAIEPNNLDVRYNEVTILESEGKTTEAIARLKEILDTTAKKNYSKDEKGNRIELLDRLWTLYRLNEQTEPAVETLRQIAELDHERDSAVEALIIDTYRIGKDLTKAQDEADTAVKRWPDDRTLRVAHATVLGDMGQTDAAAGRIEEVARREERSRNLSRSGRVRLRSRAQVRGRRQGVGRGR